MISERILRLASPLLLTAIVCFAINSNGGSDRKKVHKKTASPQIVQAIDDALEANQINSGKLYSSENVSLHDEIYSEASQLQRRIRR